MKIGQWKIQINFRTKQINKSIAGLSDKRGIHNVAGGLAFLLKFEIYCKLAVEHSNNKNKSQSEF